MGEVEEESLIKRYIEVNPRVCHGKPVFKGTRIMVSLVLEMLAAGETTEEILQDYPSLSREHIRAALIYSAGISSKGHVAALV